MKKITKILLFTIIFIFGCEQGSNTVSPPIEPNYESPLISLPTPEGGSNAESEYTVEKVINGWNGGTFYAQYSYEGGPFGTVTIISKLQFPSGAFSGYKTITQTFNSETASVTFGPAIEFNQTVEYDITITGVDLSGVNPDSLDFVYIANNGTIQYCEYEHLWMDQSTGRLHVDDAELQHFSRYGFVNRIY